MVIKTVDSKLTVIKALTTPLAIPIGEMVVYKEQIKLSYEYRDANGEALGLSAQLNISEYEVSEDIVHITVAGLTEMADNAPTSTDTIRIHLDSTIRPTASRVNMIPNLTAEELQEELTKRDLQDEYVLRTGSVDPGTVHGDNLADGSVRGSKLATNSIASAQLADGAVTAPKIADGAVTAAKLAPGSLYTPAVSDPVNLSTLDVTKERDGNEVAGDWVFINRAGNAEKLTASAYHTDHGIVTVSGQLGKYAIGLVRRIDGADAKIAVLDGAIVGSLAPMTVGRPYALNENGGLVEWSTGMAQVGVAISTTELMLKRD